MVFAFILQTIFLIYLNLCNLLFNLDFYCVAKSVNRSCNDFSPVEEAYPDMNLDYRFEH